MHVVSGQYSGQYDRCEWKELTAIFKLQATVGLLVAKTLTNATANPFLAGGAGAYNPVLALDVFLVQVI